ncbi:hypothetical protein GCM10009839_39880 [Catenulispora yoronensis]|uniref:Uncharacterized protein n=1 Tax=Catenulispora yoronensis TaxID=450799 RepID=A0ABN2UDH9_9ACTN
MGVSSDMPGLLQEVRVIDGPIPDGVQPVREQPDQNPESATPEDDHPPHDPDGSHWKPPSDSLAGWSNVVGAAAAVIAAVLAAIPVLHALR